MEPTGPNAEQIEYWNDKAAASWVASKETLDALIGPLGHEALERANVRRGESALDVGCGTGQTTLELAERVGPEGSILAIDISRPMLEVARQRAAEAGASQVRFENADAQTHPFAQGGFDLLFSRFGVMFFVDPVAAFSNLHRALAPGGRMSFVCWQELGRNPWMREPVLAAARHVELEPPKPAAPGPMAFADSDRVRGILEKAGFENVAFESLERTLLLGGGGGLDAAVEQMMRVGPAASALRGAGPETREAVAASIRDALAPFETPGGVRMGSASWICTADSPRSARDSRRA